MFFIDCSNKISVLFMALILETVMVLRIVRHTDACLIMNVYIVKAGLWILIKAKTPRIWHCFLGLLILTESNLPQWSLSNQTKEWKSFKSLNLLWNMSRWILNASFESLLKMFTFRQLSWLVVSISTNGVDDLKSEQGIHKPSVDREKHYGFRIPNLG